MVTYVLSVRIMIFAQSLVKHAWAIYILLQVLQRMPRHENDCQCMADYYTCKYSYKNTSELIHTFSRLKHIKQKQHLKVLSIGCGSCTDLFAFNYLRENNEYQYDSLDYLGIDYSQSVWENIHRDIKAMSENNISVNFSYEDICGNLFVLNQNEWIPDVVIFQYVFSDLKKHSDDVRVIPFISYFANFFTSFMPISSYIICNDINLSNAHGGGRDYFTRLANSLTASQIETASFKNDNPRLGSGYPEGYPYGTRLPENNNFFDLGAYSNYRPFTTCSSALMGIRK